MHKIIYHLVIYHVPFILEEQFQNIVSVRKDQ